MKEQSSFRGKKKNPSKRIQKKTVSQAQDFPLVRKSGIVAHPALDNILASIGKPPESTFVPDDFQLQSIAEIEKENDCLVIAPTGSGKTYIAQEAMRKFLEQGKKCWYASPLKALTNAKWIEFRQIFGEENVGILTGDIKDNASAKIITGTTEILRNCLYDAMINEENVDFDLVIIDEAHYLGDSNRGVVWEETLMYLPRRVNILLLSATIGNGEEIVNWLEKIRQKKCTLVVSEKRPVPLFPIFYHPGKRMLLPLIDKNGDIFAGVKEYCGQTQKRFSRPIGVSPLLTILKEQNLLPAIFFVKSRHLCDNAIEKVGNKETTQDAGFQEQLAIYAEKYPFIKRHKHLRQLRDKQVASHHAGHLPVWKFLVETMMKTGHLDTIFATTTIAAGVNFPARTVVITDSDLFDGDNFNPLTANEFRQMSGRAGRRGIDNVGFVLIVPGSFMDVGHVAALVSAKPQNVDSQIKNNFSMCLNLIKSHNLLEIQNIFRDSFLAFQKRGSAENLWQDFLRHLDFLQREGFVDENNKLSDAGEIAVRMRVDNPLIFAQIIQKNIFANLDEAVLAGLVASYAFDGEDDLSISPKEIPRRLKIAHSLSERTLAAIVEKLIQEKFPVGKRFIGVAYAIYLWAAGEEWGKIIKKTGIAEGNLVSLSLRTAEHLRQVGNIKEFPDVAIKALSVRKAILRDPVSFEMF
ncbi:MAG: DEAD/DEAH box helicase [Deltaproteobacteria bacterium]|nr:DEAD/DEAH box helicase [Deltaproteobacteria bacterium]